MIHRYFTKEAAIISVNSFVTSCLDCYNALLYGIPAYLVKQLQMVQNDAAKVVANRRMFDHVIPILTDDLHWLPVEARITFKCLVLTWKELHGELLTYISDLVLPLHDRGRSHRCKDKLHLRVLKTKLVSGGHSMASGPTCGMTTQ